MTRLNPNMLETRNADLVKGLPPGPRLRELETIIRRGQKAFVEVGNALIEIRESRLYKERGFTRFDDYTSEFWSFKRSYAHDLMASAKVVAEIETSAIADTLPATESQARELRKADEPAEVWAEVVELHPPSEITAAVIREHVEARTPNTAPPTTTTDGSNPLMVVDCSGVTSAVRAAVRAGATTQELYNAYQAGFN